LQARKIVQARNALILSGRSPQLAIYKCLMGFLVFIGLLIVILLPALVFSTLNPTLQLNNVLSLACSLSIGAEGGSFLLFYSSRMQYNWTAQSAEGEFITL
jgi:hypothetical protein